jgi:protein CpxP
MKKLVLSIVLFVALAGTTFAQKKTVEDRAKMATEKMEKDLALTADQKTTIYTANLEKLKAQDDLRSSLSEGEKPTPEQMKPINQKFSKVLKDTLTDDQKAKMAEMKAANAANKPAGTK